MNRRIVRPAVAGLAALVVLGFAPLQAQNNPKRKKQPNAAENAAPQNSQSRAPANSGNQDSPSFRAPGGNPSSSSAHSPRSDGEHASRPGPGARDKDGSSKIDDGEHARSRTADGKNAARETTKNPDGSERTTRLGANGKPEHETVRRPNGTEVTRSFGADGKSVRREVVKGKDGTEHSTRYSPSGERRVEVVKRTDGAERTTRYSPSGRVEHRTIEHPDGTRRTSEYALNGEIRREEIVHKDGSKEVTRHELGRDGMPRFHESVRFDREGHGVARTVTVRGGLLARNALIVRDYRVGRFGFLYRPNYVVLRPALVSWYDPYWYSPAGVLVVHPFRYRWGWETHEWYHAYHAYFPVYDVYPAPSYWVTDLVIAGYAADHFAATASAADAEEEARLAREDADRAQDAAEAARGAAEVAEAKEVQAKAELRAEEAEARAAKAESREALLGKANPKAAPLDNDTKEQLRGQIEAAVAEKKELAEAATTGGEPVPSDLSKTLADPKHIYPISKTVSVIRAEDDKPAGELTAGDLIKIEPGQEALFKEPTENTLVAMRVMTSKGEDGEVAAGIVVKISLKDLQEFDNEFRAKVDEGLAEADKNKEEFKKGV